MTEIVKWSRNTVPVAFSFPWMRRCVRKFDWYCTSNLDFSTVTFQHWMTVLYVGMSPSCWQSVFRVRKVSRWLFQHPDHHHHHCPTGKSPLPWIVPSLISALISHRYIPLLAAVQHQQGSQSVMKVWDFGTIVRHLFCCHLCILVSVLCSQSQTMPGVVGVGWGWGGEGGVNEKFPGNKQLSRRASQVMQGWWVPAAWHQRDWQVHQHNLMAF